MIKNFPYEITTHISSPSKTLSLTLKSSVKQFFSFYFVVLRENLYFWAKIRVR